jgi:hypothetical protein
MAAAVFVLAMSVLDAGTPRGAYYSSDTGKVFWFVQTSDTHIGASGSDDTSRLQWLVTTARSAIDPSFIVVTGDLTDSTNGNVFGYPNGPYQAEWDAYKAIVGGLSPNFYYDIPGNHDAYNDRYFAYYLANSVQGYATGRTQASWTRDFTFGTYHFLGVNSSGNTGAGFSFGFPYGDPAGLDDGELSFIENELGSHANANLTFVFGHHPVTDTGVSGDTWLFYGHQRFVADLDSARGSGYGYGHTHGASQVHFTGNSYTGTMPNGGMQYLNIASLGKSSAGQYRVFAVDCDGVSSVAATTGTWPVVLITSPVSKYVGSSLNPYAYTVPNAATNTVRSLVFDAGTVSSARFRIDGGTTWYSMTRVAGNAALWSGAWDASSLTAGEHSIEVQAVGTTARSNTIKVDVVGTAPPPPATDTVTISAATYATRKRTLSVTATSSAQPGVTLTVVGYGAMKYSSKSRNYSFSATVSPAPATVAVSSSGGGSATRAVTTK